MQNLFILELIEMVQYRGDIQGGPELTLQILFW